MINFSRIETDVFIGSAPQSDIDIGRLAQLRISAVLSLQSDDDLVSHRIDWPALQSAYEFNDIYAQRFPITDFDETDLGKKLPAPVHTLNQMLVQKHRVYVHCNAGICRAPATVLAYLCHYRGMTVPQGLEYLRRERPQVHPYLGAVNLALATLAAKAE